MTEAMACGTPVIAFKRGSVSEIVNEQTGIITETPKEMSNAVHAVDQIDRRLCRRTAEGRFDVKNISSQYLNLFNE